MHAPIGERRNSLMWINQDTNGLSSPSFALDEVKDQRLKTWSKDSVQRWTGLDSPVQR